MMRKLLFCLILLASSCSSSTKDTWSCPLLQGGKGSCISIANADTITGSSESQNLLFPKADYLNSAQKIEIKLVAPKLKDLKKLHDAKKDEPANSYAQKPKLRTEEKLGKIWFAPYIDAEGNQHSESSIVIVDEEAKWVMQR